MGIATGIYRSGEWPHPAVGWIVFSVMSHWVKSHWKGVGSLAIPLAIFIVAPLVHLVLFKYFLRDHFRESIHADHGGVPIMAAAITGLGVDAVPLLRAPLEAEPVKPTVQRRWNR